MKSERLWTSILDAIGIISFGIEGAMRAVGRDMPVSAVVVAAMLTATGGGIFRDILSHRRPVLLSENIYGLWVFLVGVIIGLGLAPTNVHLFVLFIVFTGLRILSFLYDWKIPYRQY